MTSLELDRETYIMYPAFALGSAVSLGLVQTDILPFIDLGQTFFETGNIEWTTGRVVSVLALVAVVVNRDTALDIDTWGVIETWTLYVTVGLILAPPLFPAFADTLAETPAGLVSFIVQSIGFGLVTYIN